MKARPPERPASLSELLLERLSHLLHDPLVDIALAYAVVSLFLRIGTTLLPSDLDWLVADVSGVATVVLTVVATYVLVRRMLRRRGS